MLNPRPISVPFPFVWAKFERIKNGKTYQFEVREARDNEIDELIDFLTSYFMKEETFNQAVGLEKDPLAIEEFRRFFRYVISYNYHLVCFDVTDPSRPKLTCCNILQHLTKGDDPEDPQEYKSPAVKNLFKLFDEVKNAINLFDEFGVKKYLMGGGLSVHPDYRGMGLAYEVMKARDPMCKAFGFTLTTASFTGIESQNLAEKCGYRTVCAMDYEQIGKKYGLTFSQKTKYCKIMVLEYEQHKHKI